VKKAPKKPKPTTDTTAATESSAPTSSGIKWYDEDNKVINDAMQRGLIYGVRLNMAQAVRMLIRNTDLNKLVQEDYQKAAVADDRRFKTAKE
jgi:hypothetical protein